MQNPFLDVLKPTAITPGSLMSLIQEQQADAMQTALAAMSCRDPMALMALQQAFLQRTVERWTRGGRKAEAKVPTHSASRSAPSATAVASATPKPVTKSAAAPTPMPRPAATPMSPAAVAPLAPAPKPVAKVVEVAPAKPDDLTAIKGIGPKFAATLAEHGITTFRKLASLSPAEIETLEEKLGFAGRFAREGWVEQAKALAAH